MKIVGFSAIRRAFSITRKLPYASKLRAIVVPECMKEVVVPSDGASVITSVVGLKPTGPLWISFRQSNNFERMRA
jgi:hypothetical protein